MKEKVQAPELRFEGFTDDWEERKVSEITDFHKQGFYTKESYNENKKYYLLRGTDMTSNKLILKDTPKINASEKDYEDFKVLKDDFLIVRSGTVGTYAIVKSDITAIFGSYLINFRFNQSIVLNEFFGLFYQSSLFKSQLNKIIQKSSNVNINAENIKSTNIKFPTIEEQQKIGAFFKQLDETIALHQRKLDLLKEQKKGFLQKMFPKNGAKVPELRFAGFADDWEERKLDTIFNKIRNAFVGTATPYYVDAGHFYLESNNIKNGQINRDTEVFINDEFYNKQTDKLLHTGDIVMVQSGHVGHTAVIPQELDGTAAHALIMFTDYKEKTDSFFLNYQFQTYKSKIKLDKITTGNTIKHILSSEMKEFFIDYPSYEEQQKIGSFFKRLDATIALHQRKLDLLKEQKKGFLQKMFV
ncbi:Type I restriction-modification system specificity subunit S [Lactococcus lactis subsp. lactis bv. diacetylactis]|uniref:restriction endonuclease subunit S n=1 Tax=Lactococcus lactis TaxID=1358 RepID=UPI0007AEBEF0|nr:restriction endonuclease subunit S [Lactococcus lactis]KZK10336.1 Type I restriction-modification system specificity subunit S [Lactococcus lactis subsp. lactis bv. diacetylactis]